MKTTDVKPGNVYLTRIAGALCPVVVIAEAHRTFNYTLAKDTGPKRFRLARVGERALLPKPRTAAALREIPDTIVQMKGQPWEVRVTRDFTHGTEPKRYNVAIPEFNFGICGLEAKSPVAAAVYTARGLVARTVFGLVSP